MRKLDEKTLQQELSAKLADYMTPTFPTYFKGRRRMLDLTCNLCGAKTSKDVFNLKKGAGLGCVCQRNRKYHDPRAQTVGDRYDAMKQRCRIGTFTSKNYGDRGIQNRFKDREHYIRWVLENLPHKDYKGMDIDRINNEGHYEPGNLRLVPRSENIANRRNTPLLQYRGHQVPRQHIWHLLVTYEKGYRAAKTTTINWLAAGLTLEEVLERGTNMKPRPGRSKPTTYLIADPAIVSRYPID